jgi:hypothetical protein
MKVTSNNLSSRGFSVLEVVIAMAILMVVISGVLEADRMINYWALSSVLSQGAVSLVKADISTVRQIADADYYDASSTKLTQVSDVTTPYGIECQSGGFCYGRERVITDISPCAKLAEAKIYWHAGLRYPTSSVAVSTYMFNQAELHLRGGDCLVVGLEADWTSATPTKRTSISAAPVFTTAVDSLDARLYVVSSSSPQLRIYDTSNPVAGPILVATSSLLGNRLNAIDVIRDSESGRRYAFVMQHTRTDQLLVIDVTNDIPIILATRSLYLTEQTGSFPQGWRVLVYGNRVYVVTRETAGMELHIFSIAQIDNPVELLSSAVNLSRTVNDFEIREERAPDGVLRRYLFLAASAALKEFAIYEVTNDVPIERLVIDLPGTSNALSLTLLGDTLFLGRQAVSAGPELYQYRVSDLLNTIALPTQTGEVGADVHSMYAAEDALIIGTSKVNAELQVWQHLAESWDPAILNAGRSSAMAQSRMIPLGFDFDNQFLYVITQSATQPEQISLWSTI